MATRGEPSDEELEIPRTRATYKGTITPPRPRGRRAAGSDGPPGRQTMTDEKSYNVADIEASLYQRMTHRDTSGADALAIAQFLIERIEGKAGEGEREST